MAYKSILITQDYFVKDGEYHMMNSMTRCDREQVSSRSPNVKSIDRPIEKRIYDSVKRVLV